MTEEQRALAESVSGFTARHVSSESTRAEFEDLAAGMWPAIWPHLVEQGILALHLPARYGGDDAGLVELAVVLEETGRRLMPGPLLPTLLTSLVVSRHGRAELCAKVLPRFAAGSTGACATTAEGLAAVRGRDGWEVTGTTAPVLGALSAEHVVLGAQAPEGTVWFLLEPDDRDAVKVTRESGVDPTRDIGCVTAEGLLVPSDRVLSIDSTELRSLAAALFSAEATGIARWCQETGLEYVKVREQFGRAVGSFQAIKHKCARMFVQSRLMSAAAWDAASALGRDREQFALAAASAAVTCLGGIAELGLETVTLFGGIGYTWEHDAHLYWRRGMSLAALLGPVHGWEECAGRLARVTERTRTIDLSHEEPGLRARVAEALRAVAAAPADERRRMLAEARLVSPHYPEPYGMAADPAAQVVISQEYERAGLAQPSTVVGEWALPTIIEHGTESQRERFVMPTLRGEIVWCQLFSEPAAGSDLASLRSRAERRDGGWLLNGQKVWTSSAHEADWGICLARTDPDAPKHKGLSYFLVDMRSPGLRVRPLREANGGYMFNEVFFDDVFVPGDCLVGRPGEGWRLARTTLGNERVSIGSGMSGVRERPARTAETLGADGPEVVRDIGALTARINAFEALGQRVFLKRLSGLRPGAESSVLKVASSWNAAEVRRVELGWAGARASVLTGQDDDTAQAFLSVPSLLIGGGTSEIQLNVIAEQVLGLPREQVR
ncbi:acyl-CoA dehydrogenase [Actinomadura vinacea]|uniref:Acyl-CoA dehydrogenase n=1 Tax=Actinomadura vinacea TaxID=115336 RepID=A0ABN3JYA1_9ACTN